MERDSKVFYPRQAQIFISEVCSMGCSYCSYTSMSSEQKKGLLSKELPIEQWQDAVKFLHEVMGIKLITLIGGEPTAKKGIENLVDFINRETPEVETLFVTSGIPLLRNDYLRQKLVEVGMKNVIVSIDGIRQEPKLEIDITRELGEPNEGSQRKSVLGLYFLLKLREEYPEVPFKFGAGCIVNKETLRLILPTYHYLAAQQIYLNLCPEQTKCFGLKSKTVLTEEDNPFLEKLVAELVNIKNQPGNFLMNSKDFLEQLSTTGIGQSYKCSERPFPTTINVNSEGGVPFCSWRKSGMKNFNIMELVKGEKNFQDWLKAWQNNNNNCSCSWSFLDRVGDFHQTSPPINPNIWYGCV
jgi:sulfatase maturation enzyme AslB (radical SAM superfamily)